MLFNIMLDCDAFCRSFQLAGMASTAAGALAKTFSQETNMMETVEVSAFADMMDAEMDDGTNEFDSMYQADELAKTRTEFVQ